MEKYAFRTKAAKPGPALAFQRSFEKTAKKFFN
jgi:hypothetical protein